MGCNPDALYLCLQNDLIGKLTGFDPDSPPPDLTIKQFAAVQLRKSLLKKYVENTDEAADQRAIDKFLAINTKCRNYSPDWKTELELATYGEIRRALDNFWFKEGHSLVFSYHDLFDQGRTGPGSSLLARGNDFYTKLFSSPLSATSHSLYDMYKDYVERYPTWNDAECKRLAKYGDVSLVEGNKLVCVPKTVDVSRTICVEPNLNMFAQLGMGRILEGRLREVYGIDLAKQPDKNRELARIGSRDDSYVTIDLASASDSLSLNMLEPLLPKPMLNWLKLLRSPVVEIEGLSHKLHMVSTMGNGTTFPLQTILFTCVVSACYRVLDLPFSKPYGNRLGNFGVFGDDIIVDKLAYRLVIRMLEGLGFSVNTDKSFVEGPFRESCGSDWYFGRNVRGVYIKSLRTQQDRYVAINNLNSWSARVGIPLPETVQYLMKHTRFQPVPIWDNDDAGIKVPSSLVNRLHRSKHTGSLIYKRSVARTVDMKIDEEKRALVSKGGKERIYNPSGLLLAFLRGDIRKSTISLSTSRPQYCTRFGIAPNWDYFGLAPRVSSLILCARESGFGTDQNSVYIEDSSARRQSVSERLGLFTWRHWESAVYSNLML